MRVSQVEEEIREFHAEVTERRNLQGKRNMASLDLGAGIAANTQGGVWVSGGKGERMQGSQRRSEYQTKGRLEQTG